MHIEMPRPCVRTYREGALAVAALEAGLVVRDTVGSEEVDEVDRLVAGFALVLRTGERHGDRALRACTWQDSVGLESSPSA